MTGYLQNKSSLPQLYFEFKANIADSVYVKWDG